MKPTCPRCRLEIPLEDVNVATDVALCRRCGNTYSFAELTQSADIFQVDLSRPPRGAWLRNQGNEFEVGSTLRSFGALFLVPFTLVWSGFSMGGIYGRQITHGHFNLGESLFGIPFLLGTVVLVSLCLMATLGKVAVRISGEQGAVFTGVGPIGWTRRFNRREVKAVRESLSRWQQNGRSMPVLELEGGTPIRFGSGLSEQRRHFMLAALRQHLRC